VIAPLTVDGMLRMLMVLGLYFLGTVPENRGIVETVDHDLSKLQMTYELTPQLMLYRLVDSLKRQELGSYIALPVSAVLHLHSQLSHFLLLLLKMTLSW
jgi:phosphate/sulfate permease